MNPTSDTKALLLVIELISSTIKEAGSLGIPEGHLYAGLMTIPGFRVEHLNMILDLLVKAGKITRSNYLVKGVTT